MPVYNAQPYLREAVDSILRQTFADFELIAVDDGSTDRSGGMLSDFAKSDSRVRILRNELDKGIVGALNTGLSNARGQMIARMDADDVSLQNRFAQQIAYLKKHPDLALCGSWVRTIGRVQGNVWKQPVANEDIRVQMLFYGALAHPAVMWKREAVDALDFRYDQNFIFAEDYELFTRFSGVVNFGNIPKVLLHYRTHYTNVGSIRQIEQEQKTRSVQLRELKRLGIEPSRAEFEIHRRISSWSLENSAEFLSDAGKWLDRLQEANSGSRLYDQSALERFISAKRADINGAFYEPSPGAVSRSRRLQDLAERYLPPRAVPIVKRAYRTVFPVLSSGLQAARAAKRLAQSVGGKRFALERSVPPNFRIGMAVLAHERPDYLEMCLDSLFQTKLHKYDITFLVIDDGSSDPRVREIINRPRDPAYRIVRVFSEKGHNSWGAAFNKAMRHLLDLGTFDIVGTCDADALFHPDWLDKTMKIALWAKKHHRRHTLGPFSSFNSSDEEFHEVLGSYKTPYGSFSVKKRMGALNYFYFRKDLETLGMFAEHRDDETLMTAKFMQLNVRNFCTTTSYVEHIGQLSVLNQWRPVPLQRAVHALNLEKKGWPVSLKTVGTLGYFKDTLASVVIGADVWSQMPIDVMITAIAKDKAVLPLVIEGVRRNLRHPINAIRVVAPDDPGLRQLCKSLGCEFVDEEAALPGVKDRIDYKVGTQNRRGWLFQQLLKLSGDTLTSQSHYLVIDADTVLVTPQTFERRGQPLLLHSDEFHRPYFEVVESLLGSTPTILWSFVSHQMLFSVERLKAMKTHIETRSGRPWIGAILDNVNYDDASGFSEFELYGQWCMDRYPVSTLREYWFNKQLQPGRAVTYASLARQFGGRFRSVSLHSYLSGH